MTMANPYTFEAVCEENARLRRELAGARVRRGMAEAEARRWKSRAVAVERHSRVGILTRLVGRLQEEIAARDVVLRVGDEAR